ncbi:hypothetical protein BO85DRAFT_519756 [Aspergillus piperis CBS 112811]|uniref:Uncharacterized protein n=1 Tax=Aspergillus piperis CBS 112811 TaxID=1448313 RepID=A0A8G1R0J6_9EURO|nr:hypothetical protein BO85DRAFT_519756 [Aspergillus piperis CBS 112811]RAH57851.1 hypothetical protein BO85DRAFT_519756 [Aspergillus piperis CBS 112811]
MKLSRSLALSFPPIPPFRSSSLVLDLLVWWVSWGFFIVDFNNSGGHWIMFPCFHFSCSCDCPSMAAQVTLTLKERLGRETPNLLPWSYWTLDLADTEASRDTRNRFPRLNSSQSLP